MNRFDSVTKPLMWFMALLLVALAAGCGGAGQSPIMGGGATVSSITVTPTTASIPVTGTQQFVATAKYSDATTAVVTKTAIWTSGNAGATVGLHTGLATGVTANGTPVIITATLGTHSATAALTVTPATLVSIAVTPLTASITAGGTQQFVATGTFSDGSHSVVTTTASWTSATLGVATIGLNTGLATGVAAGTTNITATLSGKTSSPVAVLTVTAAAGPVVCTTGTLNCVDLGTAANYVILAKTGVDTIPNSVVTGDIGLSPAAASFLTGFPTSPPLDATGCFSTSTQVIGKLYASDYSTGGCTTPALLTAAVGTGNPTGMEAAYTNANGLAPSGGGDPAAGGVACPGLAGPGGTAGAFGGMTLTPGVYTCTVTIDIATGRNLTLNGAGIYVFRTTQGITQASGTQVILTGGALPQNVFWVPALTVAITGTAGVSTQMAGVILAKQNIAVGTNATVTGRLLAQTAVTLDAATITQP